MDGAADACAPLVFIEIHGRSWNGNIHAEEPGHQRQWSHDQRNHSELLHNEVHLHSLIAQVEIDHRQEAVLK